MGKISIEDCKYYCDFCGKSKVLSEVCECNNTMDMFILLVDEISGSERTSGFISYKDNIKTIRKSFVPKFHKYKKHVICKDCLDKIESQKLISNNKKPYKSSEVINLRNYSVAICNLIEEILESKDITIPNDSRQGDEGEARLYGDDYFTLENGILQLLTELVSEIKDNPIDTIEL